jgi:N-acetylglucosamine kinase-like BadF-type ATPase
MATFPLAACSLFCFLKYAFLMRYVLGFDGGGTKTDCVLMDESGAILARGRSGPSNPLRVGFEEAVAALQEAARLALAEARLELPSIAGICAGLAGTRHPEAAAKVQSALSRIFPAARICVLTDLALSLEATGECPSVVLVAGTGSAAIGWDSQRRLSRVGGYGPLISDQGSAYNVGRQAIQSVLRDRDRTGTDTPMGVQILRQLKCPGWKELQERVRTAPDEIFPHVFPLIATSADDGDEGARQLLRDAAFELALLVEMIVQHLCLRDTTFLLAKTGGMIGRSVFLDAELDERLEHAAPRARIRALPIPPVVAAARVALQLISTAESAGHKHERD